MKNEKSTAVGGRIILGLILALFYTEVSQAHADAAKLYKAKCAMCHAADGSGNTPAGKSFGAKDLRSHEAQERTDAELTETITKGKNKMPAYDKKLTADEIKGLVGYIRELAKKK